MRSKHLQLHSTTMLHSKVTFYKKIELYSTTMIHSNDTFYNYIHLRFTATPYSYTLYRYNRYKHAASVETLPQHYRNIRYFSNKLLGVRLTACIAAARNQDRRRFLARARLHVVGLHSIATLLDGQVHPSRHHRANALHQPTTRAQAHEQEKNNTKI